MVNLMSHMAGYIVASVGPCFVVSVHQENTIQWEYASLVTIIIIMCNN